MTDKRRTYTKEFKVEAVRMVERTGRTQQEVADELGVPPSNIHRWRKKYGNGGPDAFPGRGRLMPKDEQIRELRRENEILRQERDILKKAVTIFSQPSR
jgi:transposase